MKFLTNAKVFVCSNHLFISIIKEYIQCNLNNESDYILIVYENMIMF